MTVEELLDELRSVPPTSVVTGRIRQNEAVDGTLEELYEFREAKIDAVVYSHGETYLQLDE